MAGSLWSSWGINTPSHCFNIFLNHLDDAIERTLTKLVDDTELGGKIDMSAILQRDQHSMRLYNLTKEVQSPVPGIE